jgi:hypothetical protein
MSADTDMVERLRSLASALGAGGLDETDPAKLLARVEWGVDHIQQVEAARSAQVVEELSKQPRTTWGEVKKAILARAALDASGIGEMVEALDRGAEALSYALELLEDLDECPAPIKWCNALDGMNAALSRARATQPPSGDS